MLQAWAWRICQVFLASGWKVGHRVVVWQRVLIAVCEGILLGVTLRSYLDGREQNVPSYPVSESLAWP